MDAASPKRAGLFYRLRQFLNQFKKDLKKPIEGNESRSFFGKIGARFRFLFKKYGWKLVAAVLVYYLVRDTILYIILPYFAAKQFL